MHSVKLTLLIEDPNDIDMEVRVVAPVASVIPTNEPPGSGRPVSPLRARAQASRSATTTDLDDYVLGGYAGI
ncbi:hypothetical protein KPL74_17980 [Bacillus sp. NP157]|nr:hypothetical protein KPL74_17980 [Bacillus sp. NP157]